MRARTPGFCLRHSKAPVPPPQATSVLYLAYYPIDIQSRKEKWTLWHHVVSNTPIVRSLPYYCGTLALRAPLVLPVVNMRKSPLRPRKLSKLSLHNISLNIQSGKEKSTLCRRVLSNTPIVRSLPYSCRTLASRASLDLPVVDPKKKTLRVRRPSATTV